MVVVEAVIHLQSFSWNQLTRTNLLTTRKSLTVPWVSAQALHEKVTSSRQFARDMRKIWNNCISTIRTCLRFGMLPRAARTTLPTSGPGLSRKIPAAGGPSIPTISAIPHDRNDSDTYNVWDQVLCVSFEEGSFERWHCPACKPKLKTVEGTRMLSAAENAARKCAELGGVPRKKLKQTMVVKWSGLGYEHCTWET
jgi:hypothetical protein